MGKNKNYFTTEIENAFSYMEYFNRITEIALTIFEWKGLPETIDPRFLELCLFYQGYACFFKDEVLGYLALRCTLGGTFDVYNIPKVRNAYAPNGYGKKCTDKDSVIIFNNYLHTPSSITSLEYARKLYELDRTIDINIKAQKTPILLLCSKEQQLTLENVYKQYDGNRPVIVGNPELFDTSSIKSISTGAPFVAPTLMNLKNDVWNECMTYLGVPNIREQKRERMIVDEVQREQGGVLANQYTKLTARQNACEQINNMFPELNVSCDVRANLDVSQFKMGNMDIGGVLSNE